MRACCSGNAVKLFAVSVFLLLVSACVTATPKAYRDAKSLPPKSPAEVEVFWTEPEFAYHRIGEVNVRACPACSNDQIEAEIQKAVAQIGGDVAIVASDATRAHGAVIIPGPTITTVVPTRKRQLLAIAALRVNNPQPLASNKPLTDDQSPISFETDPPGAEVYLDGQFIGTTPLSAYPVQTGTHQVAYTKSKFATWTRDLRVGAAAPAVVRITLERRD